MEAKPFAIPENGLELLDDEMKLFYEEIVAMAGRFVPVAGKTISEVLEALEALEESYDDYQGGLNRMYQARRAATVLTEEQKAMQRKLRLYYFTCHEVKELQAWLNGQPLRE